MTRTFIWSIADLLSGPYRPREYGTVILPFTVLVCASDASTREWASLRASPSRPAGIELAL
ncbi:type I restriction-modification system subunit M N-terminal domain-containing protein [Aestuariimicrobium sp. p3-SID1156]|uniref:type I restriction-modification system subunit M N-terminal domain-containing protein n=1 Tax=Aestuariimicrobium sp. p3-SID1156 TaxID=2916038 RepID=UPI0037C0E905